MGKSNQLMRDWMYSIYRWYRRFLPSHDDVRRAKRAVGGRLVWHR